MRADLRPFFEDDDFKLFIDLLQADGCGEPGGASTDHQHIARHGFTFDHNILEALFGPN